MAQKHICSTLLLACALLLSTSMYPQTSLDFHARVGKTSGEQESVLQVLEEYLNSDPGSQASYEKYWSTQDRKRFPGETDLSRNSLFQFEPKALLSYFRPLVLKAEKVSDHFEIQVMFHHSPDANKANPSSPFAILTYFLAKEKGQWKLSNAVHFRTANWRQKQIGNIRFHFPQGHAFDEARAEKSRLFCQTLTQRLNLDTPEINYYVCTSGDELGWLLGFDFFFAGYTTGKAFPEHNIVLSGLGTEYYPHELAHLCLPGTRSKFIDEGLATYFGGTLNLSYEALKRQQLTGLGNFSMEKLAECFEYPNQTTSYFVGALLVEFAIEKQGLEVIPKLQAMEAHDANSLLAEIQSTLGLTEAEFFSEFSSFLGTR